MQETKDVPEETINKSNKSLLAIASFILGLICIAVSIGIMIFPQVNYLGGGTGDLIILFGLPLIAIYPIGISICILALRDIKKRRSYINYKLSLIGIIIGLIGSLTFLVAIPVFFISKQQQIEADLKKQEEKRISEENAKIEYAMNPTMTQQLAHYSDCYSFYGGNDYRAGRDAVCSYLRYTYSHDWQEPETGAQLEAEKYTPSYFTKEILEPEPQNIATTIGISSSPDSITRGYFDGSDYHSRYVITPHTTCSRENNDSVISVWYLDHDNIYKDQNNLDFVCLYYDYHSDTVYSKTDQYKDTSFNIYKSEFKELYEKLLKHLYQNSVNLNYKFSIPNQDANLIYNNEEFIKDFFTDLPSYILSQ